jgi:hypothetical protein
MRMGRSRSGLCAVRRDYQRLTIRLRCPSFEVARRSEAKNMKRMLILVCGLAVLSSGTQLVRSQDAMESQLNTRLLKASSLSLREVKPNEIIKNEITYSGIAVEAIKTDNLLQLFNPAAPVRYGSAEDNTLRDSVTGRASAWKIFSIRF